MPARDVELFLVRLARWWPDLAEPWVNVYGPHARGGRRAGVAGRADGGPLPGAPPALVSLDLERTIRPDWFQEPSMIGYVCYADRFGGTLARRRGAP